jgi:hypothetical protein
VFTLGTALGFRFGFLPTFLGFVGRSSSVSLDSTYSPSKCAAGRPVLEELSTVDGFATVAGCWPLTGRVLTGGFLRVSDAGIPLLTVSDASARRERPAMISKEIPKEMKLTVGNWS